MNIVKMQEDLRPKAWIESRPDGAWRVRKVLEGNWSYATIKIGSWGFYEDDVVSETRKAHAAKMLAISGYQVSYRYILCTCQE